MRPMIRMFVLAAATVSASAAFAATKVTVNVPFDFETRGHTFPAGQYEVNLDVAQSLITLRSHDHPAQSARWIVAPADFGPDAPTLSMKFDDNHDGTQSLRSIRLATRTTPVLDVREHHAAQNSVSITGGR